MKRDPNFWISDKDQTKAAKAAATVCASEIRRSKRNRPVEFESHENSPVYNERMKSNEKNSCETIKTNHATATVCASEILRSKRNRPVEFEPHENSPVRVKQLKEEKIRHPKKKQVVEFRSFSVGQIV